jgi:hypothetical protein
MAGHGVGCAEYLLGIFTSLHRHRRSLTAAKSKEQTTEVVRQLTERYKVLLYGKTSQRNGARAFIRESPPLRIELKLDSRANESERLLHHPLCDGGKKVSIE